MKKYLILCILLCGFCSAAVASPYSGTFTIRYLRVNSDQGFFYMSLINGSMSLAPGCACDSGGCYVGLPTSNSTYNTVYSMALSVMVTGKQITVIGDTNSLLAGSSGYCSLSQAMIMP